MEEKTLEVSNPLQAASEVFYRPKAVFNTIGQVNNWSWVPFLLVSIMIILPSYLYYQVVDVNWAVDQFILAGDPDMSPAEMDNMRAMYSESMLTFSSFFAPVALIILHAIIAGYYTFVCRNDEKNVQGYTDWYGATWWISMPIVINGLFALLLLALQDAGSQISLSYTSPLSLAFVTGAGIADPMFNLLNSISLPMLWSIVLAAYCINSWTSFSFHKSAILAAIPTAVIIIISLMFSL